SSASSESSAGEVGGFCQIRKSFSEFPYSRQCLLTRSSKVDRKPPRLRYPAQSKVQPSWQEQAERLVDWDLLRGLPPGHVQDAGRRADSN
uniref:hypothetical protein n=1 Tax=Pseudomonas aeruginosa TaxID=287 RepID=UPI003561FB0B